MINNKIFWREAVKLPFYRHQHAPNFTHPHSIPARTNNHCKAVCCSKVGLSDVIERKGWIFSVETLYTHISQANIVYYLGELLKPEVSICEFCKTLFTHWSRLISIIFYFVISKCRNAYIIVYRGILWRWASVWQT